MKSVTITYAYRGDRLNVKLEDKMVVLNVTQYTSAHKDMYPLLPNPQAN
jgi:hypothetical protein